MLAPRSVLAVLGPAIAFCISSCAGWRTSDGGTAGGTPPAAPVVRTVRIHGVGSPSNPPVLRLPKAGTRGAVVGSTAITLRFDVQVESFPNLELRLIHCDRNWKPTENTFVQDYMRLRSTDFEISPATLGRRFYDYTVSITFPRSDANLRIEHSGNYIARVVDIYDEQRVYAEARFYAIESRGDVDVQTYGDFYDSPQTDVVQKGLRVFVEAETDIDLFTTQISAIALVRWGDWYRPLVASRDVVDDEPAAGEPRMRWGSFLGGKGSAEFFNLPAGNEHRILDLTDVAVYPSVGGILTTPLSDLPRQGFAEFDNDGVLEERFVSSIEDEYVYFQFRLDLMGRQVRQDLFVVGTFNNWTPSDEWRLSYDPESRLYMARGLIRRARHEYQYVAGTWDADLKVLRGEDASLIEGNTSMTTRPFLALVYYTDISGYDRIIAAGKGWTAR